MNTNAASQAEVLAYALSLIPTTPDKRLGQLTRSRVAAPEVKQAAAAELARRAK